MRPLGVTILAILGFIGVIGCFAVAGIFAVFGQYIPPGELGEAAPLVSLLMTVGSFVFVVIGLVNLVIAYGLWKGASWAWWIYLILLALGIVSSLFMLPQGGVGMTQGIIGIIINGIIIYYITRPHVKEYFGV